MLWRSPQIKVGNIFKEEEPNFGAYIEMVDIPETPTTTYGETHVFEQYFDKCFEGRYVSLEKFYGDKDIVDNKPFEFSEVMVWVE